MAKDGSLIFDTKIDSKGFEGGLKGLSSLAGKTFGLITKGVMAAGTALVGFGGFALKVGAEFDASMSEVAAISGATGKDLEALRDKAKEMGATTKFSASESAEALKYMAMAGWQTEQMLDALPGVMNLAAASGESLGMVSDIVTDSMTAFGLAADKAADFADILAAASSNSNTNVGMLGESFKYVAPLAGALGYTAEDTALALGLMANAGIKSSQAGTSLRSAISRLVKPVGEAKGAIEDLGIEMSNADGTMKPFREVLGDLRTKFADLTDEQKSQYAASLFGQEAMSGMLAIIEASDEDFNKLAGSIDNSTGAAEEMARVMNDNLKGDITILKSALEGLGIQLYESVDSPLRDIAQNATGYIEQLSKAFTSGGFKGIAKAVGDILSDIVVNIADFLPSIAELGVGIIQNLILGLRRNSDAIGEAAAQTIITLVNAVIELTPRLIMLGINLIVSLVQGIAKELPNLSKEGGRLIRILLDVIKRELPQLIKAGLEIIEFLGKGLADALPGISKFAIEILTNLVDMITTNLPILLETGVDIILGLIDGIIAALPGLLEAGGQIITTLLEVISANIPMLLSGAVEIVLALVQGITESLPALMDSAIMILMTLVETIMTNIPLLLTAALGIILALVKGIVDNLPSIIESTIKLVDVIIQAIMDNLPEIIDAGIEVVFAIMDAILDNLDMIIDATFQLIEVLIDAIFDNLPKIVEMGIKLVLRLIDGIVSRLPQIAITASSLIVRLLSTIAKKLPELLAMGVKLIVELIIGIVRTIPRVLTTAASLAVSLLAAIGRGFIGIFEIGANLIIGLWNGIASVKDWILSKISGFVNSIVSGIKSFFGIKSPSKLMADEIGKMLPSGISLGFEAEMPDLKRDVDKELSSLTKGMQRTVEMEAELTSKHLGQGSSSYRQAESEKSDNKRGGMIHTEINIDGKPVGDATTPYVSNNLARQKARRLAFDY